MFWDRGEVEGLEHLRVVVEVEPCNGPIRLAEADVVEPGEGGTCHRLYPVVGHQEVLLPPHEEVPGGVRIEREAVFVEMLRHREERRKLALQETRRRRREHSGPTLLGQKEERIRRCADPVLSVDGFIRVLHNVNKHSFQKVVLF